jgi:hypothetical protein
VVAAMPEAAVVVARSENLRSLEEAAAEVSGRTEHNLKAR